ncbi:tRNA (guanosine(46)-N7)-methyltransferase TrmB [Cohnella zeiphila]|uniref:tRNA (guanine-N(7)-)-methyltransferase n=1 Tax=Cohnella zeiphila TaxID=2761120 RepID=A0A7X0SJI1_9BACL|nr:tRNA (guanosine(46)-N7)-methyltransferase TrmB [Cohnella zeiphila]MBB6731051.1 tRNA (guanosine(46)-N7)-methyltransferase TrmB [Cohnella zeiphila]
MRLRSRKNAGESLEKNDLVVLEPGRYRGRWRELFGNDNPIRVEIGMGKGQFISRMSASNPGINYLGMDMFDELLRKGSAKAKQIWLEKGSDTVPNLFLVRGNAERLEEMFAPGELDRIYLNFSDPWPKSKHAKRRLTHSRFLEKYKEALNERGEIHFKTDSLSLFEFSLNSFSDSLLQMRNISLDLHRNGLRDDLVMTEYETKFVERGQPIYRLEAVIGSEAIARHRSEVEGKMRSAAAREEARQQAAAEAGEQDALSSAENAE